jgi:hypothetical protein
MWESFTRVLENAPRNSPATASRNAAPVTARTHQQRAVLGERGGVGTFSTEFVDPATPRGARWGGGPSDGSDTRGSSPIIGGGGSGSNSSVIGMQPAYMLMQKRGDGSVVSERHEQGGGEAQELDLSRRGLRSGGNNGGGIAFTRVMREFR